MTEQAKPKPAPPKKPKAEQVIEREMGRPTGMLSGSQLQEIAAGTRIGGTK